MLWSKFIMWHVLRWMFISSLTLRKAKLPPLQSCRWRGSGQRQSPPVVLSVSVHRHLTIFHLMGRAIQEPPNVKCGKGLWKWFSSLPSNAQFLVTEDYLLGQVGSYPYRLFSKSELKTCSSPEESKQLEQEHQWKRTHLFSYLPTRPLTAYPIQCNIVFTYDTMGPWDAELKKP